MWRWDCFSAHSGYVIRKLDSVSIPPWLCGLEMGPRHPSGARYGLFPTTIRIFKRRWRDAWASQYDRLPFDGDRGPMDVGNRSRNKFEPGMGFCRRVRSDQGPTSSRDGTATVQLHARRAAAAFRSGRLMSHGIITEIRDARKELLSLSIKDREQLVRRIVDELHAVRTSDFSDSPFANSTGPRPPCCTHLRHDPGDSADG